MIFAEIKAFFVLFLCLDAPIKMLSGEKNKSESSRRSSHRQGKNDIKKEKAGKRITPNTVLSPTFKPFGRTNNLFLTILYDRRAEKSSKNYERGVFLPERASAEALSGRRAVFLVKNFFGTERRRKVRGKAEEIFWKGIKKPTPPVTAESG